MDCLPLGTLLAIRVGEIEQMRPIMVPLARPSVGSRELAAIEAVLKSGWLGMGPVVRRFEKTVASFVGARHCIAVSSGTAALHLALEAVGVRGAEVIVPSLTFAATVQAILAAGGIPVFADCREDDLNVAVEDVERRLSARTRVILPVHYAGRPADLDRLLALARDRSLVVVEDAAHAFGSSRDGVLIGASGHLTCFSFDPIKTVTCCEGGAVCTNAEDWAEAIRRKRRLGFSKPRSSKGGRPDQVVEQGFRCHMSDVNAAVGLAQMERINELIASRRRVARSYDQAFRSLPGLVPLAHNLLAEAPFCYTVRVLGGRRAALMRALAADGIETAVLYPPNHRQPAFAPFTSRLPVTERIASQTLSLPLFAGMTEAQVDHVIDRVATNHQRCDLSA
jgi:perosamine synthetase